MPDNDDNWIQEGLDGILAAIRARVSGGADRLRAKTDLPARVLVLRPHMRVDAQVHRRPLALSAERHRVPAGESLINEDLLRRMVREEVRAMFDGDFGNRLIAAVRTEMERQLTLSKDAN